MQIGQSTNLAVQCNMALAARLVQLQSSLGAAVTAVPRLSKPAVGAIQAALSV